MPLSRRALLALLPATAASTLAACGTTDPAADDSTAGEPAAGGASDAGGGGGNPIQLTDGAGETVELPAPSERAVALEWSSIDDALSVGGTLVGASDPAGYAEWASALPLPDGITDVGLRTEPSIETIAGLEPDLILGITESIPDGALEQMREIAPTLLLTGADATRPLELMRENHLTTGQAFGTQDQAQDNLDEFDAEVEAATEALAPAAAHPYVFVYPFVDGSQVTFRVHGTRSLPGAVGEVAGLTNAYTEPGDDAWGLGTLDLEGMTTLPEDTRILYWGETASDPVEQSLSTNDVWNQLPAVQQGNVHRVAESVWVYGGPASQVQWLHELVRVLA